MEEYDIEYENSLLEIAKMSFSKLKIPPTPRNDDTTVIREKIDSKIQVRGQKIFHISLMFRRQATNI